MTLKCPLVALNASINWTGRNGEHLHTGQNFSKSSINRTMSGIYKCRNSSSSEHSFNVTVQCKLHLVGFSWVVSSKNEKSIIFFVLFMTDSSHLITKPGLPVIFSQLVIWYSSGYGHLSYAWLFLKELKMTKFEDLISLIQNWGYYRFFHLNQDQDQSSCPKKTVHKKLYTKKKWKTWLVPVVIIAKWKILPYWPSTWLVNNFDKQCT